MDEEKFFNKLCWVCLAEEGNMNSLLNMEGIQIDDTHSAVTLQDLLQYVISAEIFFTRGPYLLCDNCKAQATAAYKFKKRCEVSLKVFKKFELEPCKRDDYDCNVENENLKEEIEISLGIGSKLLNEEDELLNSMKIEDNAIYLIVDENESAIHFTDEISYIKDPIRETKNPQTRVPKKCLCTVCGQQKSRNTLKQHMLRHANVKNYECTYCQKKFNDKGNLIVHTRIHTGIQPYSCDICGKKFIQSTGLKTHKRIHDGVKPYKCHLCNYMTRTSSHLQLHIKRHVGTKNYHCELCDYSACSKAELRYHQAKHSNDKCHVCNICNKGFTRLKGLKTHLKSHTGEKPHVCQVCGNRFTQGHSLRTHLKTIHKSDS